MAKRYDEPECTCCRHVVEHYESAISHAANNTWVCWRCWWSSVGFEFTIEEFIERPSQDGIVSKKLRTFGLTYL